MDGVCLFGGVWVGGVRFMDTPAYPLYFILFYLFYFISLFIFWQCHSMWKFPGRIGTHTIAATQATTVTTLDP